MKLPEFVEMVLQVIFVMVLGSAITIAVFVLTHNVTLLSLLGK